MRYICRIILLCTLLIITRSVYAQTSGGVGAYPVYNISEGASIVLHAGSSHAAAYQWYKDGMKISGAYLKDYKATTAGVYTVVAFNIEGCPSDASDGIRVAIIPIGPVTKPDTVVDLAVTIKSTNTTAAPGDTYSYVITAKNNSPITGTQVQISYVLPPNLVYVPEIVSKGTISYDSATRTLTWSLNKLNESDPSQLIVAVKVLTPGVIQSIVDIKGRELDPIMANNVDQTVQQVNPLVIPNIFTPNGDGVNETFFIPGLETYSDTQLTIINRWGNTVYQKTNYQNDWNGQGMVEGTYFYVLRAKNKAGIWDTYKGYLTLLRTKVLQ